MTDKTTLCSVESFKNGLKINAGLLRREWRLDPTGATTCALTIGTKNIGLSPEMETKFPECVFDGLTLLPRRRDSVFPPLTLAQVETESRPGNAFESAHEHLTVEWNQPDLGLRLLRKWSVYAGANTIVGHAEIQSDSNPQGLDGWKDAFDNIVDSLPIALAGWRGTAVQFFGRTDYHNEYVKETTIDIAADSEVAEMQGNLLFLESPDRTFGFFLLHEAPPENEKRPECACTFRVGPHGVQVLGWGIRPHEISPTRLRRSYSVAIGAYQGGGSQARLEALRRYLKLRFPLSPVERAIVTNPWGDGKCYERFCESFLLEEIAASAKIGATHYQIDDGWQAGGILADLTCNNLARKREFWEIDKKKLPDEFSSLLDCARANDVALALWFAPDVARGYRNWEEDRDILLEMHRKYAIDLVKIDGVRLYNKEDEEGLINLMTSVTQATAGRIRFNLDVTNGMRLGYFANLRFGTIFVENRYVIGKPGGRTYFPWRVLRNLWELSRYVPPEKLQMEFANLKEAAENQAISWDRITGATPLDCSWEYAAAVTLMAAPLCWLQPSRLPADAQTAIKKVMDLHAGIADELAQNFTFPIGDIPDGTSWTGFWSYAPDNPQAGLLLVFRENNDAETKAIPLAPDKLAPGNTLELHCLSHDEVQQEIRLDNDGALRLTIPARNDFRLYRYLKTRAE